MPADLRLAEVMQRLFAAHGDMGFSAFDGSTGGPADAEVQVAVVSPRALSYLAGAPGQLGLARAYVAGEIDVRGDPYEALRRLREPSVSSLSAREWARLAALVGRHALQRAPRPSEEVRLRGRRHSKRRDAAAIAHHYDVSNRFYGWILGPSMAYSCGVYPTDTATLEEAQFTKFDLVALKLGLRPGMRLLDVGCGWGGMVLHAARHYGVTALGVTLSRSQAEWARNAIAEAGLSDRVEVRYLDYRDVPETGFDAVSSIGMMEHVGRARLAAYVRVLHAKLRPGGRLLNHCIMRPTNAESRFRPRGFINRYVFPDGELLALGHIVSAIHDNGFEVRHTENLREHYARTLAAWSANLEAHWRDAVAEAGERRARIWRLYMAGSRLAFERNEIQLHQVLATKTDAGRSGMPLRPDWEPVAASMRHTGYEATTSAKVAPSGRSS
jgi:cyclopropane-fatty-acyl-phospholipid synthase